MENILKGKLDRTQKSNTIFIVTTINRLIIKPVKKLVPPVFYFKQTQQSVCQNSQILALFDGNLGATI